MAEETKNSTPDGDAPVTVESQQLIIVKLKSDNEEFQKQIAELKAKLESQGHIVTVLEGEKADLEKELSEATELLAGQKSSIDELAATLANLQANPSSVPIFTFKKKIYEVHALNFKHRGPDGQPRDYTIGELLSDPKLQEALIKKGVGFIIEKA